MNVVATMVIFPRKWWVSKFSFRLSHIIKLYDEIFCTVVWM